MTDTLHTNDMLSIGQSITSQNGRYTIVMQGDGNVALNDNGYGVWGVGTNGKGGDHLIMQDDGNLVVYTKDQHPVWASNTSGHPGAYAVIQTDGNFVVYGPDEHPLYASQSDHGGLFGNIASAVQGLLPKDAQQGFAQAVKIGQQAQSALQGGLTPANIQKLVSAMSPANQKGFQTAAALKVATASPKFAAHMASFGPNLSHLNMAGIALGGITMPPGATFTGVLANNPHVAAGIIHAQKQQKTIWRKIGEALHILKPT